MRCCICLTRLTGGQTVYRLGEPDRPEFCCQKHIAKCVLPQDTAPEPVLPFEVEHG